MADQVDLREEAFHVEGEDVLGAGSVEGGQHDACESAHDECVTVHDEEQPVRVLVVAMVKPDLTLAPADQMVIGLQCRVEMRKVLAEVDDVAIAALPIVEELEPLTYIVEGDAPLQARKKYDQNVLETLAHGGETVATAKAEDLDPSILLENTRSKLTILALAILLGLSLLVILTMVVWLIP